MKSPDLVKNVQSCASLSKNPSELLGGKQKDRKERRKRLNLQEGCGDDSYGKKLKWGH